MAVYKVAQDVEADDKLLGPFSFRQFIYLLIMAGGVALAWGLSRLFIPLAILPLPIILLFGALALPLRKDQPMEIYLSALISFYIKPRKRLWIPDGIESLVTITSPKVIEVQRTKNLSEDEAERRLSYLANIADTRGWAVRNVSAPEPYAGSAMIGDVYNEAQQTEDILDTSGAVAQSFNAMIGRADAERREAMIKRMHSPAVATPAPEQPQPQQVVVPPLPDPYANLGTPSTDTTAPAPQYNPYPTIHQSVVQPLSSNDQTATPTPPPEKTEIPPVNTSEKPLSPDIINLANNPDLSIETIAREAHRIEEKKDMDEEVVISLR